MPETPQIISVEIRPRRQFRDFLERVQRWACLVCHRRAGKTVACLQDLIIRSQSPKRISPPWRGAYVAPTRDQAKDVAWAMLKRFVGEFPGVKINEADLMVTFANGSTIRLYSGENYDRMRGLYFDHVVLDEFGDLDPQAWTAVIRPALSDYNGSATFIGTPKGRNGFWKLWEVALDDPEWYTLILRASESGIIEPEELDNIKRSTPAHTYNQEFECSFSVGRIGAIYSGSVEAARESRRISETVEWFRELPVYTSWDIGAPLNQRVWIFQMVGDRINFLECMSGDNDCKTPADWAGRLRSKQYSYGAHFIPHDAATEQGSLWQDALAVAGLTHVAVVPRAHSAWDGINLSLDAFPRCWFNASGCKDGIDSLDAYHSKENRDGVTIQDIPVHDWSSHSASSFAGAHQAIKAGLVIDRTAIPRIPKRPGGIRVSVGYRG